MYLTRTTEDDIVMMSKAKLKRLQFWTKDYVSNKQ